MKETMTIKRVKPTRIMPPTVIRYQRTSSFLLNLGFDVSSCLRYW